MDYFGLYMGIIYRDHHKEPPPTLPPSTSKYKGSATKEVLGRDLEFRLRWLGDYRKPAGCE